MRTLLILGSICFLAGCVDGTPLEVESGEKTTVVVENLSPLHGNSVFVKTEKCEPVEGQYPLFGFTRLEDKTLFAIAEGSTVCVGYIPTGFPLMTSAGSVTIRSHVKLESGTMITSFRLYGLKDRELIHPLVQLPVSGDWFLGLGLKVRVNISTPQNQEAQIWSVVVLGFQCSATKKSFSLNFDEGSIGGVQNPGQEFRVTCS